VLEVLHFEQQRPARQGDAHDPPARRASRAPPDTHRPACRAVDAIAVPAIVDEQTFALAQARLQDNKRFAARNTKTPSLLGGLVVCRDCGYACYRNWTRTSAGRYIYYYRCTGQTTGATRAAASASTAPSAPTSSTISSGLRRSRCSKTPA
jgi:hypothetical protein